MGAPRLALAPSAPLARRPCAPAHPPGHLGLPSRPADEGPPASAPTLPSGGRGRVGVGRTMWKWVCDVEFCLVRVSRGLSRWSVRSESLSVSLSSLLCALPTCLPNPPRCAFRCCLLRLLSPLSSLPVSRPLLLCPSPLLHPERGDRDFNGILSSLVQLLSAPEARTLLGFQSLVQREWVAAGHPFLTRLGAAGASEKVRGSGNDGHHPLGCIRPEGGCVCVSSPPPPCGQF